MSVESELMTTVSSMVEFVKTRVRQNIFEASNSKIIKIDASEIDILCNVIDASIVQSFTLSSS